MTTKIARPLVHRLLICIMTTWTEIKAAIESVIEAQIATVIPTSGQEIAVALPTHQEGNETEVTSLDEKMIDHGEMQIEMARMV